jgi:uncharacterized membrane protein YdjX (TVP38/TMEM64 family)
VEDTCAEDKNLKNEQKKSGNVLMFVAIGVLAVLVGCYFIFPGFQAGINEAFDVITSKDDERIKSWVQQFGFWGPVVLILAMMLQMFMFVVPNVLLFMIAIICYGPIWGSLISLAGVFASSSLGYLIGRRLGPRAIDRFVSQKAQDKICIFIERYGIKAIAITRLSSFSNDALSFVAGILEMSYRKYILATLCGITPLITLMAIYGNNGKIEKALIWIAAISVILLAGYIYLDRHKRREAYAKYAGR